MVKMELTKWVPYVLVVFLVLVNGSFASYAPPDSYLIACGSSKHITFQGRTFVPDSQHSSLVLKTGNSIVASSNSSVPCPIYQSARIFAGKASYRFEIQQEGRHWIRLYLCPLPNSGHNLTSASTTVVTDDFVLLSNFTFRNYNGSYMFKEYAINVTSDTLTVTFIPSNGSVAFVNAIEVVSIPDELFVDQALALNPSAPFTGLSELAFETVYRLNMGGPLITAQNDTLGRTWVNDLKYLHVNSSVLNVSVNPSSIKYPVGVTPETAPNWVYATAETMGDSNVANRNFNITWVFTVDPDFSYFIRMHFCDIISRLPYTLVNLYINSDIALRSRESITNYWDVPYYEDFIYNASTYSNTLTISLGPDSMGNITNGIMNGLEIMKISNKVGSLDGFSPVDSFLPKSSQRIGKLGIIIGSSVCVLTFLVFLGLSVCHLTARRSKKKSAATSKFLKRLTFHAIQQTTNDFDQNLLIGGGGFGKVYKGTLENGTIVAIKVANPESRQGLNEFHNEIELLCGLLHQNLVSLIGCCSEDSEMILVYKYMANGSFNSHLYGTDFVPLSWKQRLQICIGAARGLYYLHTGATQSIIHRDVKTANILLDENLLPKVADFGISKKGPPLDKSHVTTNVKGSFGYVDPEYFRTKFLTKKSDVYSFGVVLIEVICGKPALDDARPTQQINLAMWALRCHEKGTFHEMMDPYLIGKVNMDSLNRVCELAWKCLEEKRTNRPPMGYVLCELEEALHLELASPVLNGTEDSVTHGNVENGITDDIENVV